MGVWRAAADLRFPPRRRAPEYRWGAREDALRAGRDNFPGLVTKPAHMVYLFVGAEDLRGRGARLSTTFFQAQGVERTAFLPVVRHAGHTTARPAG